jgi:hypothetical protein
VVVDAACVHQDKLLPEITQHHAQQVPVTTQMSAPKFEWHMEIYK